MEALPQTIMIGDVELEMVDKGTGEVLLLLHGASGPTCKFTYFGQLARDWRVLLPRIQGSAEHPCRTGSIA